MTKKTDVEESDIELERVTGYGRIITLKELPTLVEYLRVVCEVKVLSVDENTTGGIWKQDIAVSDSTGTARLTLWEPEINKMELQKSYKLSGIMVKEYQDKKYLSTPKEISLIEEIDDIGEVEGEDKPSQEDNVRVVAVEILDSYRKCMKCTSELVPTTEDKELGMCSKCGTMQCIADCKRNLRATLRLKFNGGDVKTLQAFERVVEDIAQKTGEEVSMVTLLKSKPFCMEYGDGTIRSVSRLQEKSTTL